MANHKSAEKRARIAIRRNAVNAKTMSEVRTHERKVRKALSTKDKKASQAALKAYESSICKAAQKGRVHVKTASRKVSRLSAQIAALA